MPTETVGIRLSKYKRLLRLMNMIGLAILALVTMFTAVKLGNSGETHFIAPLIGSLFLTSIIAAGALLAYSRGGIEFQADLLERYIKKNQTPGEDSGFDETVSIEVAAEKYSSEGLIKGWPKWSKSLYKANLVLILISGILLFLYIWLPIFLLILTYSSKPKISEAPPKTSSAQTIQNLSSDEIQAIFTQIKEIKEEIKKVKKNMYDDRQKTENALHEIKQEANDTITKAEKINNEARFILTEMKNLQIELYKVVTPALNKEPPKENSPHEQISPIGSVYFDSGETQLNENGKIEVQKIAKKIKNRTYEEIKVMGHTDTVNGKTKNKILSEKRAETVKNYLVQNGIPVEKINFQGQGEEDLAISTPNGTNEPKNRRVDVILVKLILR